MTDEIRTYHVEDDPNDAPERRFGATFPTINPFIPTSLPQYVIPPVANSLYTAMQYYWYSAYQQGIAVQKQQQLLHQQQQLLHRHQHDQHNHHQLLQQQQQLLQQHHQHQRQQQQQNLHSSTDTLLQQQPPTPLSQTTTIKQEHHNQFELSPAPQLSPASSSQQSSPSSHLNLHLLHPRQQQTPPPPHHQQQQPQRLDEAQSNSNSSSSASTSSSSSSNDLNSLDAQYHHHQQQNHDHHDNQQQNRRSTAENNQHIKKPLNPFMIYMQKRRPEIVRQGLIKESAAINQLLGQQWRKLSKEEQEPYYKLAEQEKILHAQKYPHWSARDNYANQKKRKKMRLKSISLNGLDQSDKKCRARFGLSNMAAWCKPCKRKKKCIYSTPHTLAAELNCTVRNF